jgi:transposase|tara:strand:+ start:432 stop:860 length:429 start_codon:yes stop_codon:yes gene_type:complete
MKKGTPGRKRIRFSEEDYQNITKWAGLGLSEQQIADNLGVSLSSIARNKRNNDKFDTALKKGRSVAIKEVANALFTNAIQENNTTAQIFFLKNRGEVGQWSDKSEVSHSLDLKKLLSNANERIIEGEIVIPSKDKEQFPTKE